MTLLRTFILVVRLELSPEESPEDMWGVKSFRVYWVLKKAPLII